jgi:hypothetical protein
MEHKRKLPPSKCDFYSNNHKYEFPIMSSQRRHMINNKKILRKFKVQSCSHSLYEHFTVPTVPNTCGVHNSLIKHCTLFDISLFRANRLLSPNTKSNVTK